jgi:hypothetical protein
MPARPERQAGFGNGVPTHRPLPPDLCLPISAVPLWNKPSFPIPRGERVSIFCFYPTTLRAGQFAGAFMPGLQSTSKRLMADG